MRTALTLEVIEEPCRLAPYESAALKREWIALCARACSDGDTPDAMIRANWARLLAPSSEDPDLYARLCLMRDRDGTLAAFAAMRRRQVGDTPLLYFSFAMIDPRLHAGGVGTRLGSALFDPRTMRDHAGGYLAARTINPVSVRFVRRVVACAAARAGISAIFHPDIATDGSVVAPSPRAQAFAQALVAADTPALALDDETLVIAAGYARHGILYSPARLACNDPALAAYFRRHVNRRRGDCVLMLAELGPARRIGEPLTQGLAARQTRACPACSPFSPFCLRASASRCSRRPMRHSPRPGAR